MAARPFATGGYTLWMYTIPSAAAYRSRPRLSQIARLAALEVDGVADVATGTSQNVRSLLGRTGLQKPVTVVMEDGIATVTVHLTVVYGSKVMPLCEKVQENVKQTIQNMTGITVSRVDVLVVGLTDTAGKE